MSWKNDQVSEIETRKIVELAKSCLELDGDFVEMGCYKGDTSLLLAEVLQHHFFGHARGCSPKLMVQKNDVCDTSAIKRLWIYDSFEGLPEKSLKDESEIGKDFKAHELFVTKRDVKLRFLKAGLKMPEIKKAWFKDLKDTDFPEKIAFLFLDGDFYESICDSLRLTYDKMTPGGVMIIHDYNNLALPGVAKAVDEWNQDKKLEVKVFQSMAIIKT